MKKVLILVIVALLGVIIFMHLRDKKAEEAAKEENVLEEEVVVEEEREEAKPVFEGEIKKEIKEEDEVLIVKIEYPAFENQKVSSEIEGIVEAELRQFKKDNNFDNFPIEERNRIKEFGYKYYFEAAYELHEGSGLSSAVLDFSTYTGGAHGGHYLKSANYDEASHRLSIGDLFVPETNYLTKLSEISRTKIKEKLAENTSTWMEEGTMPITENFNTFYIDGESNLHIIFQPYQVGPWATGVVDISISLADELADVTKPEFLN